MKLNVYSFCEPCRPKDWQGWWIKNQAVDANCSLCHSSQKGWLYVGTDELKENTWTGR